MSHLLARLLLALLLLLATPSGMDLPGCQVSSPTFPVCVTNVDRVAKKVAPVSGNGRFD